MMHWRTPAGINGNTILCHMNTIILLSTRRRGALASDATKEALGSQRSTSLFVYTNLNTMSHRCARDRTSQGKRCIACYRVDIRGQFMSIRVPLFS